MSYEALILEMMANPPDLDEPQPLANRRESIYGFTLGFLMLALCFLVFRLYVRLVMLRKPSWDDLFVTLASISATAGNVCIILATKNGMGKHILSVPLQSMNKYFMYFYVANATYTLNTSLIKISLLLQYLRIFRAGAMRSICTALLTIICVWGFTHSFMALFPCFPVRGYWDRTLKDVKCYAYGFHDQESFVAVFEAHTAANMVFDAIVLLIPMVLYLQPNLRRRQILMLTGLFCLGATVLFVAIWRLYSIVQHKAATSPYLDFTWWAPEPVILSCIEIDIAIMCASLPIFWPVIEKNLVGIFVTHEVRITQHQRLDDNGYELEHDRSTSHSGSLKSSSSAAELTREMTEGQLHTTKHYKDRYIIEQVDPLSMTNMAVETDVQTAPKSKWNF